MLDRDGTVRFAMVLIGQGRQLRLGPTVLFEMGEPREPLDRRLRVAAKVAVERQ